VVAADSIRASDTLKEVVVYKIRAADANGEWTVSRRYSNFEQLHRQLRDVSNMMCVLVSSTQRLVAGAFNSLACQACECKTYAHIHQQTGLTQVLNVVQAQMVVPCAKCIILQSASSSVDDVYLVDQSAAAVVLC